MEPWGISGPQFLGLYAGGVVVAFALGFLVRKVMWPRERPEGPVGVEEVAFLRGGPYRVIDVAVAQLLQSGAVRVQRSGTLQATGAPARTELEQAVLDLLRRGPRSARRVKRALRKHKAVMAVRGSLVARRLINADTFAQTTMVNLPVLVVFGVGVARLVNGISLDRPVGYLWIFLLITGAVVVGRWVGAGKYKLTKAGNEFRRGLQSHRAHAHRRLPVVALTGAAGLVALGGLSAFPDKTVAVALATSDPVRWGGGSSSSSCSSSSCGSSSSSCSSSSCGGGGSSCGG